MSAESHRYALRRDRLPQLSARRFAMGLDPIANITAAAFSPREPVDGIEAEIINSNLLRSWKQFTRHGAYPVGVPTRRKTTGPAIRKPGSTARTDGRSMASNKDSPADLPPKSRRRRRPPP
jgi:hypothetical protein